MSTEKVQNIKSGHKKNHSSINVYTKPQLQLKNEKVSSKSPVGLSKNVSIQYLLKPVGPGDYVLPSLTSRNYVLSKNLNLPSYTFSERPSNRLKQIISTKHMIEHLGEFSPGVGKYTPSIASFSSQGGVITRAKKYYEHPEIKSLRE